MTRKLLTVSLCLNIAFLATLFLKQRTVESSEGSGGGVPGTPSGNGDVNCDGKLDLSDPISLLGYLFLGGPAPCACTCAPPAPVCGNNLLELPEECDDGNELSGDGCSATCRLERATCGDGIIDGEEQCDGADLGGQTCQSFGFTGGTLGCRTSCDVDLSGCFNPVCGDGTVDGTEECDDGNTVNGDGCSATCRSETTVCGDGTVAGTEECDDGNTVNGDGCSATCHVELPTCGDGVIEGAEECDGADIGGRSCRDFGFQSGSLGCGTDCKVDTSGCI